MLAVTIGLFLLALVAAFVGIGAGVSRVAGLAQIAFAVFLGLGAITSFLSGERSG